MVCKKKPPLFLGFSLWTRVRWVATILLNKLASWKLWFPLSLCLSPPATVGHLKFNNSKTKLLVFLPNSVPPPPIFLISSRHHLVAHARNLGIITDSLFSYSLNRTQNQLKYISNPATSFASKPPSSLTWTIAAASSLTFTLLFLHHFQSTLLTELKIIFKNVIQEISLLYLKIFQWLQWCYTFLNAFSSSIVTNGPLWWGRLILGTDGTWEVCIFLSILLLTYNCC
jgi:hypothetical protein